MQRTGRASNRTRRHLAGALVAAVGGASVAIIFAGSPVGAAPAAAKTVTVTFTDNGPSPSSVRINAGDSVTYVNKLTQGGSVPVVGGLLAQVQSAGVTVHDAATSDFGLPAVNSSRTLTYSAAGAVNYSATYTMKLVPVLSVLGLNLVPDTATKSTAGTLNVAAVQSNQPPPAQNQGGGQAPAQGGAAPGAAPGGSAQGGAAPGRSATGGQRTGGGLPYQVPGPGVADRVVPHGSGGGSGGSAANARPQPPLGTSPDQSAGSGQGLPQLSGNGGSGPTMLVETASRNSGLGLPAVVAVILLSVVTAALVRTLITQRRAVTA
jgi:plastocyanin